MGIVKRVDRVAFAVGDLDAAREFFGNVLGADFGPVQDVEAFKFRCQPFELGSYRMELVAPYDATSPLSHFLMKHSQGFHHLTCEVEDIHEAVKALEQRGIEVTSRKHHDDEGIPKEEVFIEPRHAFGVLIQLVQTDKT
ncbi:MAG TPA: VOC family protein [Vicinamibacteria bacterium]|nr:VOC family protein [Vicinamibacteria bacterium]